MADDAAVIDAVCKAVAAGEFAWVEAHVAADGLFHGTVGGIDEGTVLRGPQAVVAYFEDVAATFGEWHIEVEEVRRNGEMFVVFWRETTRTHELEVQAQTAMLFVVREGKIVEARGYLDRAAALEAAGLD